MRQRSIAIIIPYFGQWPEWFNLYLESCSHNPSVNWYFITDCQIPENRPNNTIFISSTFEEYKQLVSKKLTISFNPESAYKLCDLKPAYGYIHEDLIREYDFWGFGDIDVIYGDIRHFYTNTLLNSHDTLSTHWDRVSGHFFLLKNTSLFREAFKKIKNWQQLLEDNEHHGIDESKFSKVFLRHKKYPAWLRNIYRLKDPYQRRAYFKEQYSTILSPHPWIDGKWEHPQEWVWKKGKLHNCRDGNREFLYLHFMNWKSNAWLHASRGNKAAWRDIENINHVPNKSTQNGFKIQRSGFNPL
ncbi:MAG: hypothetical protein ACI9LM_005658 [Alteromonadaceae bacterium]|jgi:hypothetical protein